MMPKHLLLLLLSLLGQTLCAQNEDSLLQAFRSLSLEEQATQTKEFAWTHIFSNPVFAKKIVRQGIAAAQQLDDPPLTYLNRRLLGLCYLYEPQPDSARLVFDEILASYDAYQDSAVYAKALSNLGLVEQRAGDHESAMDKMLTALAIFKNHDTTSYQSNLLNIGNSFVRLGDLNRGKQYVGECIRLTGRSGDSLSLSNALNTYGIIMEIEEKYDSSLIYHRRSLAVKKEVRNLRGLLSSYINIGNIYSLHLDIPDSAARYFDEGLVLAEELGFKDKIAGLLVSSANELELAGEYQEAANRHARALALAEEVQDYESQVNSQWNLAMIKGKYLGEAEEAFFLLRSNRYLRDSLYRREKLEAIEELALKYETAEKERELAEAEAQLAQRQLLLAVVIGTALALLLGALLWVARERARRRQALLAAQEKGLRAVIEATETERRRIARDLHDGIGQELGSLMLAFEQLQQAGTQGVDRLKGRLQSSIGQVRSLSHQMMPRALELAGLAPALEELVQQTFEGAATEAEFDAFRLPGELDPQVSLVAYRVAQELISNVVRHAEATEVSVQLSAPRDTLALTVEDNGRGFTPDPQAPGIGLTNMRTRLQQVGGSLTYEPAEGGGTRALVRIPLG